MRKIRMRTWIQHGTIISPDKTLSDSVVIIENGRISAIEPRIRLALNPVETEIISANGLLVMPGLIDIHVHGSAGSDAMDATPEALENMSSFFLQHGVTTYLPTTVSIPLKDIQGIENISQTWQNSYGALPLGVHLEGPYLC